MCEDGGIESRHRGEMGVGALDELIETVEHGIAPAYGVLAPADKCGRGIRDCSRVVDVSAQHGAHRVRRGRWVGADRRLFVAAGDEHRCRDQEHARRKYAPRPEAPPTQNDGRDHPVYSTGAMSRWFLYGLLSALAFALAAPAYADGPSTADEAQVVKGTLQYTPEVRNPDAPNAKTPVEGGLVEVFEATLTLDGRTVEELGALLGTAESDAAGQFSFPLPGPGDYAVRLDLDSLPDGVGLVDVEKVSLPVRVSPGQSKAVLFQLVEGDAASVLPTRDDPWYDRTARLAVNGLQFGLIIGMCAIGLSLIYGTTGLVNFAHSEMITLGAVLAWMFNVTYGIPLVFAALLAMVLGALAGTGFDLVLWRPLRKRKTGLVAMSIVSIGLGLFMQYAILYQFGDRPSKYADYSVQRKNITFGPIQLSPKDLIIMALSAAILLSVALALKFTRLGKAMRAVSDNPDLAASTGIDVDRIITLVWTLGAALVSLGAVFQGVSETVSWTMGQQLLLLVFAAVTLGGLGTAFGAMAGSITVGVAILVSTVWWPSELQTVPALFLMIVILMVRPEGMFGRRERIG